MELIRPSTRALWRETRARGKSLGQFIHAYVYARWPYGYIGSAIGEIKRLASKRVLFGPWLLKALRPQAWAESYHGKAVPTDEAVRLVRINETVDTVVPESVIPFHAARELILSRDMPIVVLDCPCRLSRKNPCLPLDVCLIMGDPFCSFVLEHHPERSRAIDREEAVAILRAEAERGHVHHVFFKAAMLDRFYAICNCCSCCCGAMMAQRNGTPMLIASGYVAQVDQGRCVGCGQCVSRCPFEALSLDDGRAVVDSAACMGCGVCVGTCSQESLSLVLDATKPAPLTFPPEMADA